MLKGLSLRARLLALLGATLATGLALGVGLLMLHAASRVRAESDSTARLAREFVATALASVEESDDPLAALRDRLAEVERLRHIHIYMAGSGAAGARMGDCRRAPGWFAALVAGPPSETRIALDGRGRLRGELALAADPGDEIDEIWEEVWALALGAAALALAGFGVVSVVLSRALAPVSTLAEALRRIEQGDRDVRMAAGDAPEFVAIAGRVDALAETLARFDAENRALVERIIHVQDEERRDIARDLHDEIGPFLFSIRAGLGALARKLEGARREDCLNIDAQLGALQQVNRRILGRLRPAALDEMGLEGALQALAQGWRDLDPDVALGLHIDETGEPLDESIALTAYRIVQEGLTNVFRHASATRVDVSVERIEAGGKTELRVTVRDDGAGVPEGAREGIGLRGMGERVAALGGRLTLETATPRGALLVARLPL
ncbi:two-component system sensor histidine kinase UhpB [Methylosinus sp. sav-2]|uniref:histidine kinase n=1 Tax=Methylosinus sp. sav-2 TaxID=2485168 RepID=UPI00047BB8CB|nr:histidine kinase [Methylosinus sp. sav-2]TDX66802.1 two-component system sensor histidine kinase UhpB [Methylosinus sp. sav-2]